MLRCKDNECVARDLWLLLPPQANNFSPKSIALAIQPKLANVIITWNQRALWMSPIVPPLLSCDIAMAFMWHTPSRIRHINYKCCSPTPIDVVNHKLKVLGSFKGHAWLLCSRATLGWPHVTHTSLTRYWNMTTWTCMVDSEQFLYMLCL